MQRVIELSEPWDRRDPDPRKNYGIHGVDLRMILKGEKGCTQFILFTQRMTPNVMKEKAKKLPVWLMAEKHLAQFLEYSGPFPSTETVFDEIKKYQDLLRLYNLQGSVLWEPMAADLGYHSPVPLYESQLALRGKGECPYLGHQDVCYYDGSGLNAQELWERDEDGAPESIWKALEEYYRDQFQSVR